MSSVISDMYQLLPMLAQNIAISMYGVYQHQIRYAKSEQDYSSDSSLHSESLEARLVRLVTQAAEDVPFYARLFREKGVDPSSITLSNYREFLPVIEKSQILKSPTDFMSRKHVASSIRLFTSGTSGSPMPVAVTKSARAANYRSYANVLSKYGCGVRDLSATFAGRVLFRRPRGNIYWRKDWFNKTLYLSSYFLSKDTVDYYIGALKDWQPKYIDAYPSAVLQVAKRILEIGRGAFDVPLQLVLTSSETLTANDRALIEFAFKAPVVDHYGCTEMAVSAYSFEPGKYEIDEGYCLVESAPVDGGAGTVELICTSLLNEAMPLLRYRIGDTVQLSDASLTDEGYIRTFSSINGRLDDIVVTPEGRRIGRLDPVFKGLVGIARAQIVQKAIDLIEVRVELQSGFRSEDFAAQLAKNIRARTSELMRVEVTVESQIPLTKNGKFKAVVSEIS